MEYQEAVDTILQYSNETPVNAPNEHPLQGVIERFINNSVVREQLIGWWFNRDYQLVLQQDENGQVAIPSNLKSIVFSEAELVDRGKWVYDALNNTYVIARDVKTESSIRVLDWESLPELMQQWCMYQAAMYYILSTTGDSTSLSVLEKEAAKTFVMLKAQDIRSLNINVFNTPAVARYRNRRRPRHW